MYQEKQFITASNVQAWNQVVSMVDEANKRRAEKGWPQARVLARSVGAFNDLCIQIEYPDLATMERVQNEMMEEPWVPDWLKRIDAVETEGLGYSELWEDAPLLPS